MGLADHSPVGNHPAVPARPGTGKREYVRWRDVSMHQVLFVSQLKGIGQVGDDGSQRLLVEFCSEVAQRSLSDRHRVPGVPRIVVQDWHDIGVWREALLSLNFALNSCNRLRPWF